MSVNVRFAPSPTGMLHIGGARTALINWLFARMQGGTYHLRIEDTDRERSTDTAKQAILSGLDWLGLNSDSTPILQSENIQAHRDAAHALVAKGCAYYCYESQEEQQQKREAAQQQGVHYRYDRSWRERDPKDTPKDRQGVIRIKAPLTGESIIDDQVQGRVIVAHDTIDDFIILRSDGSPTYLLSCVVDDAMMKISHIIRGDDHLTNAFRQKQLFEMLDSVTPRFAHIPLIYGEDGKKFSKRHGAVSVMEYQKMGYLPQALINYLLLLGWGKADEEIMNLDEASKIFCLEDMSVSPARFDFAKLNHINGLYLRGLPHEQLLPLVADFLKPEQSAHLADSPFAGGLHGLCQRADTLCALAQQGEFYFTAPALPPEDAKAVKALRAPQAESILTALAESFEACAPEDWDDGEALHALMTEIGEKLEMGFGKIAQTLRAALSGRMASPDLMEITTLLGRDEVLHRIALAQKCRAELSDSD